MLGLTVIVALVMSSSDGFVLELTPSFIDTIFTENVTLKCHPGGYTDIDGSFRSVRILKQDMTLNWTVVAEIEDDKENVAVYGHNVMTSGHVGGYMDTYLTIMWPIAVQDTLGTYRCDIVGFKVNQDFVWEKTEEIVISERNATVQEVYTLVKETNVEMKKEFLALSVRIDNIEDSLTNLTKIVKNSAEVNKNPDQNRLLLANLTNSLVQLSAVVGGLEGQLQSIMGSEVMQVWPGGSYGLPAPASGCPVSSNVPWSLSFRRHHTESSDINHDQVSPNNHLLQPVIEKNNSQNFVYQHFCMKTNSTTSSLWPRGTYCINRYKDCPLGFSSGLIEWDEEDSVSGSLWGGDLPTGNYYLTGSDIYYCCRDDSSPSSPVYFPRAKPFYLYRYKGTCQKIAGMEVSEEFILFDTENTNNGDRYSNSFHPDGYADNNVRIELCYYAPS